MKKLLSQPTVRSVVADQCMYGLVTWTDDGSWLPAMKPTRFATNSVQMAARLQVRCDHSHAHQPLLGGRAAEAAFYPLGLITEILRGMRDTQDAADRHEPDLPIDSQHLSASLFHDLSPGVNVVARQFASRPPRKTVFKMADGSKKHIDLSANFKETYRDEYTQELIPQSWVEDAILDEVSYFNEKVWLGVPLEEALLDTEAKVISGRWVICNKGDSVSPDVRARYVAQEVATHEDHSFFASTPPLESKRMLLSQWASEKERNGKPLKLSFIDVRKAYFNGRPSRTIYVRLPAELGLGKSMVARLERCMYGCRDSGAIWEATYSQALIDIGFIQGVASP